MLSIISSPLYNKIVSKSSDFIDKKNLLNKFIEFKKEGVNFNLPVLTPKGIMSFSDYIILNTSINFYYDLLKNDIAKNSFVFKIEGDCVVEHEIYNLQWMTNNFKTHKDIILNSISMISIDLENNPVSKFKHISYSKEIQIIDNIPPLLHIINSINFSKYYQYNDEKNRAKIWDIAINNNSQFKNYLKNKFSSDDEIIKLINCSPTREHIGRIQLASVLFHHNLIRNFIEKNPQSSLWLFFDAVEKNQLQDVKSLAPIYHKSQHFSAENNHQILSNSRSPEVARFLMQNGFSFFNYIEEDNDTKRIVFAINREMNVETIDAIIGFKDSNKDLIHKNSLIIFNQFFQKIHEPYDFNKEKKIENIKLLVGKYNFPIDQFDMLKIGFELDKKTPQYSKFFLDHGANPNNCSDFVFEINNDNNFEKILFQYKDIINTRSPDFVYEMCKYWNANDFTENELLQKTTNGYYAWWGLEVNSKTFTKLMHKSSADTLEKIKDTFTSNNSSWLGHIISRDKIDLFIFWLEQYKKIFFNSDEKMPLIIKNENNDNALHFLLKESTSLPVIRFILEETDADIANLLKEKNILNKTPLEILLYEEEFEKNKSLWTRQNQAVTKITKKFVNHLKEQFPFDDFVSIDENAIDVIKRWYPDDNFYNDHHTFYKNNKISKMIPEKFTIENKKIKI